MRRISIAALLALFVLAGCLPSSCSRDVSRELLPQDSLSRRMAQDVPIDTLQHVWTTREQEAPALSYPRTVRFGPDNRLFVSDAEHNAVFVFSRQGAVVDTLRSPSFSHPYLAGFQGDTLVVFSPDAHRFDFISDGTVVRSMTPSVADTLRKNTLQYALAGEAGIYYKAVSEDYGGFISRLTSDGSLQGRRALPGPYWHYAGQLREWDGRILSLSGFRPMLHVIEGPPPHTLDSLRLLGFDSPMMHRTRAYIQGEIRKAPLLSAAADPAGALLFALNMRPGWLRVDAFGRDGRLRHRMVEATPGFRKDFYPIDVAARRIGPGRYEIAVVAVEPRAMLSLYRWTSVDSSRAGL